MAIVEEIIITGDSTGAEAAFRRTTEASKQSSEKTSGHAERVKEAWQRIEQQRARDALSEVRRMGEADELQKKLAKRFGETALVMGTVGAAIQEAHKALGVFAHMLAEKFSPQNELGLALTATERRFVGIKEAVNSTDLNMVEKLFAVAMSFGGSKFNEAMARMDAEEMRVRNRERTTAATMDLAGEGSVAPDANSAAMAAKLAAMNTKSAKRKSDAFDKNFEMINGVAVSRSDADLQTGTSMATDADRAELVGDMEHDISSRLDEMAQANLERRIQAQNDMIDADKEGAEERLRIAEHEAAAMTKTYDAAWNDIANVMGAAANTTVDTLFAMAEGQSVNLAAIADQFLKQTGRQLVASGIQHGLQATGMAIASVGVNPQAYAMAALAASEVAAGAAMMAGSLAIPNGVGGTKGGGGGGSSDFAAGGGRADRKHSGVDYDTSPITINVNGILTAKEAGREIVEAIERSRRKLS